MYWPTTQGRSYSCKFGYRFLKQEVEIEVRDVENLQENGLWKNIWSLQVSNKVKNFLWRAC